MIDTLAIKNYRSILDLKAPLSRLNLITGANGSGKSNLYKAFHLLSKSAEGGIINALAKEGGLTSTLWAGPEQISRQMKRNYAPVQGGPRKKRVKLSLGFSGEEFGYLVQMGLPTTQNSAFSLDPEIKKEYIWAGQVCRPATLLVERSGPMVKVRIDGDWAIVDQNMSTFESIFSRIADPQNAPEVLYLKEQMKSWRFYDHFRSDTDAPARLPQLGTRTPILHHDGRDLAAALQTIVEIGDPSALSEAIEDAFPGATLEIETQEDGRFSLKFLQHGLLRPLSGSELSDGTLRYILWVAALLTPRPPPLMVLNEPETSLHPDLLPALARLIKKASQESQVWVISHARGLIDELVSDSTCNVIELEKNLGQTSIRDQHSLEEPAWNWMDNK